MSSDGCVYVYVVVRVHVCACVYCVCMAMCVYMHNILIQRGMRWNYTCLVWSKY